MGIVCTASATLAGAAALGLGLGLTACGSATQPAAASHPAASSPAVAQPDALIILRQTGATPDPGTTSGEHDAYGNLMATGSLPGGASASVHTSASQAAFSAEKSSAVSTYAESDFTAGVVAIPAEWTVIIVNSGPSETWAKGVAPAQIAARVQGTVLLSTTPPAAEDHAAEDHAACGRAADDAAKQAPGARAAPADQRSRGRHAVLPGCQRQELRGSLGYRRPQPRGPERPDLRLVGCRIRRHNSQHQHHLVRHLEQRNRLVLHQRDPEQRRGQHLLRDIHRGERRDRVRKHPAGWLVAKRTAPGDFTADDLEISCAGYSARS